MRFPDADAAFKKIESLTNLEKSPNLTAREYRLDRMFTLLDIFDQPQTAFKSLHVAGSKGKGSTAAFLASSLTANGYDTGLYCSPHVASYKERISRAGVFFDDGMYAETASEMFDRIEDKTSLDDFPGGPPTTFELLTLLSFLIFRKAGCEWAVFETGLGGRLDATNVLVPEASLLTIIELEHTEYLGDTIEEIAGEKAGIIKPGVPVFSTVQPAEAEDVFRKRAAESGSAVFFPEDIISSTAELPPPEGLSQAYSLSFTDGGACNIFLRTPGLFQLNNASLAVSALRHIMPDTFDPSAGIANTALPGRMELLETAGGLLLMLDGAHTVESVTAAAGAFRSASRQDGGVLIYGAVSGKDVEGMAARLGGFDRIIISTPGSFKPNNPSGVFEVFRRLRPETEIELIPEPAAALRKALTFRLPVLITGSFYMVAEIRPLVI